MSTIDEKPNALPSNIAAKLREHQLREADDVIERLVENIARLQRRLDAVNMAKWRVEDFDPLSVEARRIDSELTSTARDLARWLKQRDSL